MMIIGPTNCGKTYWINCLLTNDMFTQLVASILNCYSVYQEFFNTMREDPSIPCPIHFQEGLPMRQVIDNMYNKCFHIIVLDELMEKIVKSADMQELFTKYCHHKNITAIMVSQNAFQKGPNARTISLNTHIHILFANKRDESQVSIFAHQLFHCMRKEKCFLDIYDEHMKNPFTYLAINCTPQYPPEMKVCVNIFLGEVTYTVDI